MIAYIFWSASCWKGKHLKTGWSHTHSYKYCESSKGDCLIPFVSVYTSSLSCYTWKQVKCGRVAESLGGSFCSSRRVLRFCAALKRNTGSGTQGDSSVSWSTPFLEATRCYWVTNYFITVFFCCTQQTTIKCWRNGIPQDKSSETNRRGTYCYKCLSEEECEQGGEIEECPGSQMCETRFPTGLRGETVLATSFKSVVPLKIASLFTEYVIYRGCPTIPVGNGTCFDDPVIGDHVCHCHGHACNAKGANLKGKLWRITSERVAVFDTWLVCVHFTAGQQPLFCYTCAGAEACKRGGIRTLCNDHTSCAVVFPDDSMGKGHRCVVVK